MMYGRSCGAVDCGNPLETLSGIFAYIIDIDGYDVQYAFGEQEKIV